MRAVLILLASTGCSQIFGLEAPQRIDAGNDIVIDAARDGSVVPPDALVTLTFRQGANGYTGASDTYIDAGAPNASREADSLIRVRDAQRWGLLQFSGVFGSTADRIPPAATIVSATLQLAMQGVNCTGTIADVNVSWTDTVTYNTFGPTPGVQITEDHAIPSIAMPTMPGLQSLDVIDSVKHWQTTSNNGWIFIADAGGGECTFRSGDDAFLQMHPLLTVSYMP